MFKGLKFFLRIGWQYDRRYVLWLLFYQLLQALYPLAAALLPKLVIDELMGGRSIARMTLCVGGLTIGMLLVGSLSAYFLKDGFSRRCRVDADFHLMLHQRLALADYMNLESPKFKDMQMKAAKFLTCDYHGFGYLLDCAMNILGQIITLIGLAAMLGSFHP